MMPFSYWDIGVDELHLIRDLWEQNRLYHEQTSEFFGPAYQQVRFEDRMRKFRALGDTLVRVTICRSDARVVGYCLSTAVDGVGELESIHVAHALRGSGIGQALAMRHLQWMREKGCQSIGVTVSQENRNTIRFYRKLGFYPNTLYLQQLSD